MAERYSRQISLIGEEGQRKLRAASVTIVGVGALGSVMAELLARAGVGKLTLIDFDLVEEKNLPRQALYTSDDVGKAKVEAAKERLVAINPYLTIKTVMERLESGNLSLLDNCHLVLDGTDNMETRFLLNEHCYGRLPVIFTSAVQEKGIVLPVLGDGPCYACLYSGKANRETCSEDGIINGATHLAATVATTEGVKHLIGWPPLQGMLSFSLFSSRFDVLRVKRNPRCAVCGKPEEVF